MNFYLDETNNILIKTVDTLKNCKELTENEYNELLKSKKPRPSKEYEITKYKRLLADTDYKAIKYAEGLISEEEYAPIKALRQQYRDAINNLA